MVGWVACDRVREAHGNGDIRKQIVDDNITNRLTDLPQIDTRGKQLHASNIIAVEIAKERVGAVLNKAGRVFAWAIRS